MYKSLPFPLERFEDGPETLLDFYKKLGWEPDQNLLIEPTKVVMNEDDAKKALEHFIKSNDPDMRAKLGLLWLCKGPSSSSEVPAGKVRLDENWIHG